MSMADDAGSMAKRAKKPTRKPLVRGRSKPLLVRIKIINASEKEDAEVRGIIDQALEGEFRRIDVEYD
jgi:hypothetical protein